MPNIRLKIPGRELVGREITPKEQQGAFWVGVFVGGVIGILNILTQG